MQFFKDILSRNFSLLMIWQQDEDSVKMMRQKCIFISLYTTPKWQENFNTTAFRNTFDTMCQHNEGKNSEINCFNILSCNFF